MSTLSNNFLVDDQMLPHNAAIEGILQLQCAGSEYQNYYVQPTQLDQCMANMFSADADSAAVAAVAAESLNHYTLSNQYVPPVVDENNVMAQFAADLENVAPARTAGVGTVYVTEREQERLLLQSSMSPLLAAVNDITKRDAELQLYLNQNLAKESIQAVETNSLPLATTAVNNFVAEENSEDENEGLTIADRPVVTRAKGSLPKRYLQFGDLNNITKEPSIYARRLIPSQTKFGPLEGEVLYVSEIDLDVLHVQTPRFYPLFMIDDLHIIDVTNENNSNWMRYVLLAENYAQQNLQIILQKGQIFFKALRDIHAKEELRIGYSRNYATRFLLRMLQPAGEQEWQRNQQLHGNTNSDNLKQPELPKSRKRKAIVIKTRSPSKRLLNAGARHANRFQLMNRRRQQQQKLTLRQSKRRKSNAGRVPNKPRPQLYKCHLCAKKFYTQEKLEAHKMSHGDHQQKPHICNVCQQQCATPTALAAHLNSHKPSVYTCVYCGQKFNYVRDFKQHVTQLHQATDGSYECSYCHKHYKAYHLVRKHVRLFHTTRNFGCDQCDKKFANRHDLQRHKLTHETVKLEKCAECQRSFMRRDQLKSHIKRIHSEERKRKIKASTARKRMHLKPNLNVVKSANLTNLNEGKLKLAAGDQTPEKTVINANSINKSDEIALNDGSQYLNLTPKKTLPSIFATTVTSSSNRRKQTPTKLKAVELNADTVNYVALSEMLTPYLISEQELHEEFEKSENLSPARVTAPARPVHNIRQQCQKTKAVEETSCTRANEKRDLPAKDGPKSNSSHAEVSAVRSFKCQLCPKSNFKRRGILVNHLIKVHPEIDLNEIEALRAPIVKPQVIYACRYCSRSYQSNAKRKAHTLKHHPGEELPSSEAQTVGVIEVEVHKCQHCTRQYGSRNRLVYHYRKMHADEKIPKVQDYREHAETLPTICCEPTTQFFEPEVNISATAMPENKLLKLSSAALELSRFDLLSERGADFPTLFDAWHG